MSSTDHSSSEETVVNTTPSSTHSTSSVIHTISSLEQQQSTISTNAIQLTSLTTASTPGPPEWRPYTYEHPLTAATTAMLNINGGGSEDPNSGYGILYDYHFNKLASLGSSSSSELIKSEKTLSADIWSPVVVTNVLSGNSASSKQTNGEMTEIFVPSTTIQPSSKLTSVLRRGGGGGESKLVTKLNGHRYTNGDSLSPPSDLHNSHNHNNSNHHSPLSNSNGGSGVIIVKEEIAHSPDHEQHAQYQSPQLFATLSNPNHGGSFDFGGGGNGTSVVVSSAQFMSSLRGGNPGSNGNSMANIYPVGTSPSDPYYRVDYFANEFGASGVTTASRQLSPYDGGTTDGGPSFVDRYVRQGGPYKSHAGLPVDLPSPDSGIGTEAITPRDHSNIQQGFDYTDLCHPGLINDIGSNSNNTDGRLSPGGTSHPNLKRPWHDFGRQNETDKIQIPKLFSNYGVRYYLESPISTSQRREDDRITYINKGQFYGITLEYIPDAEKPLKSQTVKTVVMLVFREEKSPEDEIKAWQFWHGRQHSVKQRILDADTKNSVGLVGCIDEIAHNAIAIYWNPLESSAKINVAVQCLSTDFSSQKGVKGLPLHLQIDTYEDPRDPNCPVFHRGYCQIKVFCDKGAERKTRDEERRAAKRKLTATGRKKLDEMYHSSCDRSEFYSMSDLSKPPVLFTPAEDLDKLTSLELHGFYNTNNEGSDHTGVNNNGGAASESSNNNTTITLLHGSESPPSESCGSGGSGGGGRVSGSSTPAHYSQQLHHHSLQHSQHQHHNPHSHHQAVPSSVLNIHHPTTILKFHHTFPPDSPPTYPIRSSEHSSSSPAPTPSPQSSHSQSSIIRTNEKKPLEHHGGVLVVGSGLDSSSLSANNNNSSSAPTTNGGGSMSNDNSIYCSSSSSSGTGSSDPPILKRLRLQPSASERLMLYARQESEDTFTPLHLVPPTTLGLLSALEEKYKISMGSVKNLYRRNSKGIVVKIDDEMLRHYCHEDSFLLDVKASENDDAFDITLSELTDYHHPFLHHTT